jgi:hypothetical protein
MIPSLHRAQRKRYLGLIEEMTQKMVEEAGRAGSV